MAVERDLASTVANPQGGSEDSLRSLSTRGGRRRAEWVRPVRITGGVWAAGLAKAGGG